MERSEIIKNLVRRSEEIPKIVADFQNKYRLKENDARIAFFGKLQTLLYATTFNCILYDKYLVKGITDRWWDTVPRQYGIKIEQPVNQNISRIIDRLDMVLCISFLQLLFSSLESTIRRIVRNLSESEYYNRENNIKELIMYLLDNSKSSDKHGEFVNLTPLFRNSIHNNGIYSPRGKNRKDTTMPYKGRDYKFEIDKMIHLGDNWTVFFDLADETVLIIREIIDSDPVSKIEFIEDKSPLN